LGGAGVKISDEELIAGSSMEGKPWQTFLVEE
jgi:hypothetical protein